METLPGFVDLQVNGYMGVDFSSPDLTAAAFRSACRSLRAGGTAAFLPTLITSPTAVLERNLPIIADVAAEAEFAGAVLGIHLEGPFLSLDSGALGAHNPQWVRKGDPALFDRLGGFARGRIRLLTISADVPGAEALTRHAVAAGVCVSLGHHLAGPAELTRLSAAGATALTHLGNGLPAVLPRHPNPVWAGLDADALTAMIIPDGHHLPSEVIRTFIRAKGVGRIVAVSDAAPVAGLPPGEYETLGNRVVLEPTGRLHSPEKGCLVGSSATMLTCMNHLAKITALDVAELRAIGFGNPLALLGLSPDDVAPGPAIRFDAAGRQFVI